MRLDVLQQLKLQQKMKLAPRMIQSMEILQLPIIALEERIDQEMEKNPVLELGNNNDDSGENDTEATTEGNGEPPVTETEQDFVVQDDNSNQEDFKRLDNIESDSYHFDYADFTPRRSTYDDEDPKVKAMSNTAAREISLNEYLTRQWELSEADDTIRRCGGLIIDNLDPDGYFRTGFDELAKRLGEAVTAETWERALTMVQQLDPPGIAARTVQECLVLQLAGYGERRALERAIIRDHFDLLSKQQYTKIASATGQSVEQVKDAVEFIGTRLILHPGLTVGSPNMPHIVPDVIIDYDETGGWVVRIADESLPNLYISGYYRSMLKDTTIDRTTKQYIRSNIQTAHWLIDAIEQRRGTLKRVTRQIVDAQTEFLENGPKFLKPLPMTQVADQLGIHVATVSRAVAGKYAQTPRGTLPLRMFFTGGTRTADGQQLSWNAIRATIQEIIDNENKTKPLSDDQIVEILKNKGIELARRTAAKYRKIMGIPSSNRRRES